MAVVDRALGLGLAARHLWTLAQELARRPGLAARLMEHPLRAPTPLWPDMDRLTAMLHEIPFERVPADDKLRIPVEQLIAFTDRLARAGEERESALAAATSVLRLKFSHGRRENWGAVAKKDAQETCTKVCALYADLLARCRASALSDLLPLVVRFVCAAAAVRAREGTLIFDDLILGPRDLLRTRPDAVRALRARYDVLLIDEFQDTDPLQVDIALAFGTDPDTGCLEPGRLFLVGDPKQSIYRFRRADMAIYSSTADLVKGAGGAFPAFVLNRRSRPIIVDWVNAVFASLIGAGDHPALQPPYREIEADRQDELVGPGVAIIGGESQDAAPLLRLREARQIAALCRAAVEEGWQVADRGGAARPASYRDIAILIPTRNILLPLQRALARAGIPHRIEGGSLIYQTQEVRDLLNCLAAIDDPADEVAVVGALRCPAFACSDVDIARHKAAGGSFGYLSPNLAKHEGLVADALRVLADCHARRRESPIAALIERFVADRGLAEIGVLVDASRDSFRRMRFVVEQARAFEAAGPESLRSFVSWLEQRAGKDMLDNDGAALDDDEDAVRVLTIHRSKGLEFPIVFLAGLAAAPNKRVPVFASDAADERYAVCIGAKTRGESFELGDTTALHQIEREHADAEFNRLLYVAATRARDHLVISLYHTARSNECGARRLQQAMLDVPVVVRPELSAAEHLPQAPFADLTVDLPAGINETTFDEQRVALVDQARSRRYTSATALAGMRKEETKDEARDETEPWARGRGGTHLGRAVHATIQSVALDASAQRIERFARAQSVAEAIPDRAAEVAQLAVAALASAAAERARGASRALREVPFAVRRDGAVLEGFIDLVIEATDGGIEIVDWKTDHITAARVPQRLKQYELQAGLYALGVEAAIGRPVTCITYVFAAAGVEASPGDPAALSAAAGEMLRAM